MDGRSASADKGTPTPGRGYSIDPPRPLTDLERAHAAHVELAAEYSKLTHLLAPFASAGDMPEDVLRQLVAEVKQARASVGVVDPVAARDIRNDMLVAVNDVLLQDANLSIARFDMDGVESYHVVRGVTVVPTGGPAPASIPPKG